MYMGVKYCGNCILNSGANRHLVRDETLLIDLALRDRAIAMADDESLHLTQADSVLLKVISLGVENILMPTDVYLAP